MIIKLPTADFSANNIGSVDLRTDVSPTTQAILDYYGKTWTLPQKFAIEDFLLKKEAWSFKTKIKRLVLPILGQAQTITGGSTNVKGFYDIITQAILPLTYGGAYTATRQIVANGLIDNRLTTGNNNDGFYINLGTPTSWQNVHIGAYYHKTRNESNITIMYDGGIAPLIRSNSAQIGSSSNRITATFDPNSYATRGLRLVSFVGGSITGLAANLPFASVTGTGIDTTGAYIPYLLNRNTLSDDITLSLLTFGDALTQPESVIYNNDIEILMNALWAV